MAARPGGMAWRAPWCSGLRAQPRTPWDRELQREDDGVRSESASPARRAWAFLGWPRPARTAPMAPPRAPRHDSPGKANGDHTDGRNHAPCWRNVATCTYAVAFQRMGRVPYQPRRLAHATQLGSRFACQSMNINFQLYPSRDKLTYKFIVN